jgi:peptidoglycan/LPS O-acetylase OafA/YrhL
VLVRLGHDYRRDIAGLRAVAILSVLAFHAAPQWLPGGFVGVDIFFVISGYLITGIVLRELQDDTFSFLGFYGRRIRRIFPALVVVLAFVSAAAWLMQLPPEYKQLGAHVAAGSGFVANVLLYRESGYFDLAAEFKPLLHLWSLGIEEQFYILWPLFLWLTWRSRQHQFALIIAVAALSFLANAALVRSHPEAAFYLPQARFWELLLGAILVYAESTAPRPLLGAARTREAVAWVGSILLLLAMTLVNRSRLFPGWWALLPTGGATALIAAGPHTWLNRQLLGNRVAVFIGLISYPLYLWHWPLLSLTRIIQGTDLAPLSTLILVALAFALATLTYYFVELPLQAYRPQTRMVTTLVTAVAVLAALGLAMETQVILPRSAQYHLDRILRASQERAFPGPRLARVEPYGWLYQQGAAPAQVLFFGDSNMAQYYPRIDRILTARPSDPRGIVFASIGGCPPIPGVREDHHPGCEDFVRQTLAVAHDPAIKTVVIGAAWHSYFVDPDPRYRYYFADTAAHSPITIGAPGFLRARAGFAQMVGSLVREGKAVYLILQIPVDPRIDPQQMVKRRLFALNITVNTETLDKDKTMQAILPVASLLRQIASETGATVLDPLDALCGADACPTVTPAGDPIYSDAGHLRPSYVRENIKFLDELMRSDTSGGALRSVRVLRLPCTASTLRAGTSSSCAQAP